MERHKILIVDDEKQMVEMLQMRLEQNGYEVIPAYNGQDALEKAKIQKPQLIILDHMMPVMDGFTFYRLTRQDPIISSIPVIILTGRGKMRDSFESFAVDAFLSKPFDDAELLQTIRSLLQPAALVFSQEKNTLNELQGLLKRSGYEMDNVALLQDFKNRIRGRKYKIIIIHQPLVSQEPEAFITDIRASKNKYAKVIIYTCAASQFMEIHEQNTIEQLRDKWMHARADMFLDVRLSKISFQDAMQAVLHV
jgi:DNA-binding response OmpR family regulator